jgi:hypothetical protein
MLQRKKGRKANAIISFCSHWISKSELLPWEKSKIEPNSVAF